jgi:hypothetical protein
MHMGIDIKSKEILSKLKSTDSVIVLETIAKVRVSGSSFLLGEMIELLHDTENPEIKKSLLNLLSELKDKESVNVLIAAIKNEKYSKECKDLVACCWQNGLIYNEHLPFFIDLVINEEFLVAFEAFTVIENMYGRIEDEVIEGEILKVNNSLKSASEQKAYLLNGLLTIIQDVPEKQEYAD